ncbi:MAG: T9SS type A sorting domain-containing protein [Ignavibacteriaceae bacterium]|nr:T9SS type A sorting domain-containing protein [Ignavibacteriaceae bacterium]
MLKRITALAFIVLMALPLSRAFADVNVTFQVDMGLQITLGNFVPSTDSICVRGDFGHYIDQSDWGGYYFLMTKSATNDSIFTFTVPFPDSVKGKVLNYKFVLTHAGSDKWENDPNRIDSVTVDANQTIPLVYFNNILPEGNIATVNITFQADMSSLIDQGFIPGTDSIEVRGNTTPLDWGPGSLLTQGLADPTIFEVTLKFTAIVGSTVQWKFHANPESRFANTGWENIADNRTFTFPKQDTTIGPVAPVITVGGLTTAADTITFRVNMNGAHERFHNILITGLQSVWIGGSVKPLQWPSNWLKSDTVQGGLLLKVYDDGDATHGDATANDGIYSAIIIFPSGSVTPVFFKYGAVFDNVDTLNGGAIYLDNEAGTGINHTLALNLTGGSEIVNDKFGDQVTAVVSQNTKTLPTKYAISQNYPNPFNPTTNINYAIPQSGNVSLKLYNILGQEVATIFQGFQKAGNYVANFNASKLASGVYLYRLQAGNFTVTKKMVLMK